MVENVKMGGGAGGIDALKEALGLGSPRSGSATASGASSSGGRTGVGPRGMRMLPPDADIESLDRNVPRGTYIDIVI